MTAPAATHPATRAILAVLSALEEAGIEATRDAGAFYPRPVGVLVGLPTLLSRTLGARTFSITVQVVSGDPLNSELAVDRLFALVDDVALALDCDSYRPSAYRSSSSAEPLAAVELLATTTETEDEQ